MPDKAEVEKLKKEIEDLKKEEDVLRKRDERLKWEEDILKRGEGYKAEQNDTTASPDTEGKLEAAKPKTEAQKDIPLEEGLIFLIEEEQPKHSIQLFLKKKAEGINGLYITRSNPEQIKKKYSIDEKTRISWLTSVKSSNTDSISGLQELSILISNFIDENNKSIIHLDGLEYLISNNEFQMVLRLIQQVRDRVSTSNSIILLPLNPNALEQRQLTLLERECRTIRP
ncbi:DUF835 domain-containing protein [Candidatus Altiarchaeota archaeon]